MHACIWQIASSHVTYWLNCIVGNVGTFWKAVDTGLPITLLDSLWWVQKWIINIDTAQLQITTLSFHAFSFLPKSDAYITHHATSNIPKGFIVRFLSASCYNWGSQQYISLYAVYRLDVHLSCGIYTAYTAYIMPVILVECLMQIQAASRRRGFINPRSHPWRPTSWSGSILFISWTFFQETFNLNASRVKQDCADRGLWF